MRLPATHAFGRRRRPVAFGDAGILLILIVLLPALWLEAGWRELADAPQGVYRTGVPHTDRSGVSLGAYAAGRSFLPIGDLPPLTGPVSLLVH